MKKIISIILAVIMVASAVAMLPVFTVGAAESESDEFLSSSEQIEVLVGKTKIPIDPATSASDSEKLDSTKLLDSDFSTKIEGDLNGTVTITWQTDGATTVAYYAIYTGADTASYPGRNPESWVLYGSTDGINYTPLDTVAESNLEPVNMVGYVYKIDTPAAYQYYKIEITNERYIYESNGQWFYYDYFQLQELTLYSDVNRTNLDTDPNSLTYNRYKVDVSSFSAGNNHGFLDGNMNLSDFGVSQLTGYTNSTDVLNNTKVYLNGVAARFNQTYLGYTHCGRNSNDGYFYGIVGAGYKAGEQTTLTLLIGDKYYATGTFTPSISALAVESSNTEYYSSLKKLVSTVTFAEDHGMTEGQKLNFGIHDEHPNNDHTIPNGEATVTKVDGNTVTLEVQDFTTSHSLVEFTISSSLSFSVPIDTDVTTKTETAVGYVQTRDNANDPENYFDTRIIVEAHKNFVTKFQSATIEMVFTVEGGTTVTTLADITTAFESIVAGNDTYTATDNCALFGVAVTGVPFGTSKVAAKVYFDKGLEGETMLDIGYSVLTLTKSSDVETVKAMTKYDAGNITVTATADGKSLTDNENASNLFNGNTGKHGSHQKPTFTVSFETKEPIAITGIIFTIANDTYSSYLDNNFRTYLKWTLYGVIDDDTKDVVAISDKPITYGVSSVANGVDPDTVDDGNRDAFVIVGAGQYSSYILEVTADSGYTQMGEITLYTK